MLQAPGAVVPCGIQLSVARPLERMVNSSKGTFPVVIASTLYGSLWRGNVVNFVVDNLVVVQVLNNMYSSNNHLMHLVHLLIFLASYHNS